MSKRIQLFVVVSLAFLPAIGLYWYASGSLQEAHRRHHEAELLHQAERMGLLYDRVIGQSEALLGALSEMDEVRRPRYPECNELLASVMRHLDVYTGIQLIEVDGFVGCSSLTSDELFVGDRYYHQAALANRQFTIGHFTRGRVTGKAIVGLAVPVVVPGSPDVSRVLAVYLDLDELANRAYELGIPREATFTVLDRAGTVMVRVPAGRSPSGADTIGATVPASFPATTGGFDRAYLATGVDLDGEEKLFAVEPLRAAGSRTYGHVYFGVDEEALYEAQDRVDLERIRLLALGGLLLAVMAWAIGYTTLAKKVVRAE